MKLNKIAMLAGVMTTGVIGTVLAKKVINNAKAVNEEAERKMKDAVAQAVKEDILKRYEENKQNFESNREERSAEVNEVIDELKEKQERDAEVEAQRAEQIEKVQGEIDELFEELGEKQEEWRDKQGRTWEDRVKEVEAWIKEQERLWLEEGEQREKERKAELERRKQPIDMDLEVREVTNELANRYPIEWQYNSMCSLWQRGLQDNVVTREKFKEASEFYGTTWHYAGD